MAAIVATSALILLRLRNNALHSLLGDLSRGNQRAYRLEAVLEMAPAGLLVVDPGGRIELVNKEIERLFGYSRGELLGKPVEILIPETLREVHLGHRAAFHAHPEARQMGGDRELFGLRKDGVAVPIEVGLNTLETDEGLCILTAIVDVSKRKRADQLKQQLNEELAHRALLLARTNQELEQFAYVASHDLQEPLRKISSYVQLLEEECGSQIDETGQKYLHVVIDGADRLRTLVVDLLAFSRIHSHGKTLVATNANVCLEAALENLELAIRECAAQITTEPLPWVLADESQLILLFQNLIGNALKYRGPAPPAIHVGGRPVGAQLECSIQDNGIGIEAQFFARIFQIFQRLHNRREFSGNGIGLANCKRIVERFGGRIWLESELGVGSTFFFTLNTHVPHAEKSTGGQFSGDDSSRADFSSQASS